MNHTYPMMPLQGGDQQTSHHGNANLLLNAARAGAVVGVTGAAAVNLHRIRHDEATWRQAMLNTAKVGATTAVATTAAAAVGQMFRRHPLLSMAATLAAGTAVMYALTDKAGTKADE